MEGIFFAQNGALGEIYSPDRFSVITSGIAFAKQ